MAEHCKACGGERAPLAEMTREIVRRAASLESIAAQFFERLGDKPLTAEPSERNQRMLLGAYTALRRAHNALLGELSVALRVADSDLCGACALSRWPDAEAALSKARAQLIANAELDVDDVQRTH